MKEVFFVEKIIDFFNKFKAGEFGYGALKNSVSKFDNAVSQNPDMSNFMGLFNSLASILPYIMIAVMFLFIFWGKKLLPAVKFISCFAVGFGLGVYFVSDIVSFLPAWVSGVVIGILAAIIYRFLYIIFFAVAGFYTVFTLCNALLGNLLASLGEVKSLAFMGIAAVGMLLMFVFRKYVEMFGTAFLGSIVFLAQINANVMAFDLLDMKLALGSSLSIGVIGLVALVPAIVGFIVQVKTRRRY